MSVVYLPFAILEAMKVVQSYIATTCVHNWTTLTYTHSRTHTPTPAHTHTQKKPHNSCSCFRLLNVCFEGKWSKLIYNWYQVNIDGDKPYHLCFLFHETLSQQPPGVKKLNKLSLNLPGYFALLSADK